MSAYVVSHDHIDALLTFAVDRRVTFPSEPGQCVTITAENATEIGRVLLLQNVLSVAHRYAESADSAEADSYRFRPWHRCPEPVAIVKGCDCLDYQSCERDDWDGTMAKRIVDAVRAFALTLLPPVNDTSSLPGWDNASGWSFTRPAKPRLRIVADM